MLRLRLLNAALAVVFTLLLLTQVGSLWFLVYGVGAFWTLIGAAMPRALVLKPVSMLLSLTMACLLLALFAFWPQTPGWWQPSVFWSDSEARHAIGLIMVALGMVVPLCSSVIMSREARDAEAAAREAEITARHTGALAAGTRD